MANFAAKVHKNGPDELVVESGGVITVKSGGAIDNAGDSIAVVTPADFVSDASVTLTDTNLSSVAGVDGTGSNAASKADVDSRLTSVNTKFDELDTAITALQTKLNAALAALQDAGIMADS